MELIRLSPRYRGLTSALVASEVSMTNKYVIDTAYITYQQSLLEMLRFCYPIELVPFQTKGSF
jgi:hypothetical protein